MGFDDEVEQSFGRPCRLADSRSKPTCELTSSIVPRGTPFHCWVDLEFSPIGFDPERFSCCRRGCLPGPPELGAIKPYAVHDDGQPASQGHLLVRDAAGQRPNHSVRLNENFFTKLPCTTARRTRATALARMELRGERERSPELALPRLALQQLKDAAAIVLTDARDLSALTMAARRVRFWLPSSQSCRNPP